MCANFAAKLSYLPCLLASLTCTIMYHVAWPSPLVTRPAQNKTVHLGFICSQTYHLFGMKFDTVLKPFKLNTLILLLSEIKWNKGRVCCFTDFITQILMLACFWTVTNWFGSNLIMMIDAVELCIWYQLSDLGLHSRSQVCQLSLKRDKEVSVVGVINFIRILSCLTGS